MESGHRAVLVFDGEELVGVLTMRNLIQSVTPAHLLSESGAPLPCAKFSPMFGRGSSTLGSGNWSPSRCATS
jgi:hypothetical protein